LLEGRICGAHEREQFIGELHIFGRAARNQTKTPYDRSRKFLLDGGRKPLEGRRHFVRGGESFQTFGQSGEIP
jgi:hypothetical protein